MRGTMPRRCTDSLSQRKPVRRSANQAVLGSDAGLRQTRLAGVQSDRAQSRPHHVPQRRNCKAIVFVGDILVHDRTLLVWSYFATADQVYRARSSDTWSPTTTAFDGVGIRLREVLLDRRKLRKNEVANAHFTIYGGWVHISTFKVAKFARRSCEPTYHQDAWISTLSAHYVTRRYSSSSALLLLPPARLRFRALRPGRSLWKTSPQSDCGGSYYVCIRGTTAQTIRDDDLHDYGKSDSCRINHKRSLSASSFT